jgi:tripartite-type tricarboxylate transporter receptor subunit TctC
MALPDIKQRVTDLGADVIANTPQQFTAQIKREVARWGKVVKDANIPAN